MSQGMLNGDSIATDALGVPRSNLIEQSAGQTFVDALLLCMLLLAVPIKNSAYILPPVFIALQFLSGNSAFIARLSLLAFVVICLSMLSLVVDSLCGLDANLHGLMFGVITYATLATMLALRSDFTISPLQRQRLTYAVSWFVIFQSVIGLMQFAASGDSDAVCGTFGLLDFRGRVTISQVFLTFTLFAMSLYLVTDMAGILPKIAISVAMLACMLAHSGHQTIFMMASLAIVGASQLRFKHAVKIAAAFAVLAILTASLSSVYWADARAWYEKVVLEDSPKKMVMRSAAEIMSSPKNMLLGVGMGQFGSRAALISSGEYLTIPLPEAFVGKSEYYRTFIRPALDDHEERGEGSAISQPFCSALNLVVEFGVPLASLLAIVAVIQFVKNRRLSRSADSHSQVVGIIANVGLVFFVLCCFIENYAEFPQAVFVPALLYVAARASTSADQTHREGSAVKRELGDRRAR